MELWTVVSAVWISTWLMSVYRTHPIISYMAKLTPGGELIVRYKYTHMVIYVVMLLVITPLCWQLAFSEDARRRWCRAYIRELCRSKT
jgi:hypothetical protein|tara:strand:+ start:284 stop:547 length:264 start_codon:yes stop_codon:yes gene_type:complete